MSSSLKLRSSLNVMDIDVVIDAHNVSFLPRDASAERGDATVSRPSVCLSVCLSVCP